MEIREVAAQRILNPTSIDLGDYVINPYKGCAFSCLYCYAQFNKVAMRDSRKWGSYIDIRLNSPLLLERELLKKKPKKVLLGSTTECFQPCEKKYALTKKILALLNKYNIKFSILTRAPLITESINELQKGNCNTVYFTVNNFSSELKKLLEPASPNFEDRYTAVKKLKKANINVIPYFSPILPFVSDLEHIFLKFRNFDRIDFEGLNFNLGNINKAIDAISKTNPKLTEKYKRLLSDNSFYNNTWDEIQVIIGDLSKKHSTRSDVYVHGRKSFFDNKYK